MKISSRPNSQILAKNWHDLYDFRFVEETLNPIITGEYRM